MINIVKGYLEDEKGNTASISFFGSLEAARAALESNHGCSRCTNCTDCVSCVFCSECVRCKWCMAMKYLQNIDNTPELPKEE